MLRGKEPVAREGEGRVKGGKGGGSSPRAAALCCGAANLAPICLPRRGRELAVRDAQ